VLCGRGAGAADAVPLSARNISGSNPAKPFYLAAARDPFSPAVSDSAHEVDGAGPISRLEDHLGQQMVGWPW